MHVGLPWLLRACPIDACEAICHGGYVGLSSQLGSWVGLAVCCAAPIVKVQYTEAAPKGWGKQCWRSTPLPGARCGEMIVGLC